MASKAEELFLKKLGLHIAELRKKAGLTQTALAHLCDQDRQNFNKIEKGTANSTTLTLLTVANALNVSFATLFDFSISEGEKNKK